MAPVFVGTVLSRATAAFVARFAVRSVTRDPAEMPNSDEEQTAIELIANSLGDLAGSKALVNCHSMVLREAVLAVIERRYGDPAFDVESIAAELYVSRRHLYRAVEGVDKSLSGLIAELRIEAAKALMRASPQSRMSTVAGRCGFASLDTFRSRFRAIVGISPSDYRALQHDLVEE